MNDEEVAKAYLDALEEDMVAAGIVVNLSRPKGFGINLQEYMNIKGFTKSTARRILDESVKKGVLVVNKMLVSTGHNSKIYCRRAEWNKFMGIKK